MQHRNRWMLVILVIAGLLLSACRGGTTTFKFPPAHTLEDIEGVKDIKRVRLVPKAAERLGVKSVPVVEEYVLRKRKIGGEVVGPGVADPSRVGVRLLLDENELPTVDRTQPAQVLLPLAGAKSQPVATARAVEAPRAASTEGVNVSTNPLTQALYYVVDSPGQNLAPGQRVLVEVPLAGGGLRKVIPYSAVVFDTKGKAFVYTNPEPLVYVRHPVTVEFFESDWTGILTTNDLYAHTSIEDYMAAYGFHGRAVLTEGPPAGTLIESIAVSELFGAETGIGK
jgi:hypothetical protein